jgi:hypothetical protein
LKKFKSVTKGPFLICAVKLFKGGHAHRTAFRQFAEQFVLSWLISDEYDRPTFSQTGDTVSKKPWPWLAEFSYFLDNQPHCLAMNLCLSAFDPSIRLPFRFGCCIVINGHAAPEPIGPFLE